MTKEVIGDYARRITQTSRTGLVVVTFEIIDQYLLEAVEAHKDGNLADYVSCIGKAKQFLNQLMNSLDFRYAIAKDLMCLYMFVEKYLIQCEVRRENVSLDEVRQILKVLHKAFMEVEKEDQTGQVMKHTQTEYEGLTYGRDGRNRISVF